MKKEFSAGGIVLNNQRQVLLVQHAKYQHWGFPKGHIELGETSQQAALREVREESGVIAEIIDEVGTSEYFYTLNKEKRFKEVKMFLMKYLAGDLKDHDWEVSEAKWFDSVEALKKLTFAQDQELLKQALLKHVP